MSTQKPSPRGKCETKDGVPGGPEDAAWLAAKPDRPVDFKNGKLNRVYAYVFKKKAVH